MKTLLKIVGAIAFLALVALVVANGVAARRLAGYEERWKQAMALTRQQDAALRMPVLYGDATDENAAEHHRALIATLGKADVEHLKPVIRAAQAGPCAPLTPEALALLGQRRAELAQLHDALRGRRVDWSLPYEQGFEMQLPSLLAARTLGGLLVVEGNERAQAGDANGAAESYLLATRLGADLGAAPVLIMNLIGIAVSRMGVDALGLLVADCPSPTLDRARLAAAMDRVQPVLLTVASGLRGERLALGSLSRPGGAVAALGGTGPMAWIHSARPLAAHAIATMDPMLDEMARAAALDDPREYRRVAAEVSTRSERSWNVIVRISMPSLARARVSSDELRARFRLARAALALEQARVKDGSYPSALSPQPGMEDPFAWPAPLHYRPSADGTEYTLWSVGSDDKDDGGDPTKDIVLEHPSASAVSK